MKPRKPGTEIFPNPKSTGEQLRREAEFAELLSKFDPEPRIRALHFLWLESNQAYVALRGRRIGWNGHIFASDSLPGGGYVFKVRMRPAVVPELRSPIRDYVVETYLFNGRDFTMIDSDALIEKPHLHAYPLLD